MTAVRTSAERAVRGRRPVLLFWCQHSLGLGHLARALRLADGLAERFAVVLLNGGRYPAGTAVPAGVDVVNLPAIGHDDAFKLISHEPGLDVADALARRRAIVLETFARVRPDVVLVEMYPFGRRKLESELLPLLDAAAALGDRRPRVVCSLRDILVHQRRDQAAYDERVCQRANASFDAILVHADPRLARLEESFQPSSRLDVPVHYTGFVAPARTAPCAGSGQRLPRVLVSTGGGMVGEPLVRAAVAAHRPIAEHTGLRTTVVAGPFLPDAAWGWLQEQASRSPALDAVRRVDDLCAELRRSAVSVSQAGYNSTMDLLRARVPAVVVPFEAGGEDEQRRRAERLAALGLVRVVRADELDPARLAAEVRLALAAPLPDVEVDLDGQAATARVVAALLDRPLRRLPAGSAARAGVPA